MLDSLNAELFEKIEMLQAQKEAQWRDFNRLLNIEQSKNVIQQQIAGHWQEVAKNYEQERDYYISREKKVKRQRNAAVGLGLLLTIVSVIQL